ncbi:MAG: hypothetical protein ABIT69_07545 [Sphingomicrobium sp.]
MKSVMLACLTLFATAPALASPPVEVRIDLASYSIAPKPIHLAAGRPVRLVITNRSGAGHDFTARSLFAAARDVSGPVNKGSVELAGNQSAVVTLTPARGRYKANCSHFGHSILGMKSLVIVE